VARQLDPTRVVVVGAGAVGGVAVLPLVEAGLDVVALEAGGWLDTREMAPDELKLNRGLWPPGPQKVQGEVPTSRATETQNASQGGSHPMMNAVGGTANHYMAQAWRLNPWDFRVRSATVDRYGAGRLPEGSTVEDWPLDYAELEPFYDLVEHAIGVSGKAGNLAGRIDADGNVFEGPRAREYPMPALRTTSFMQRMIDAGRELGWNPFVGPAAITSQPYQGRPGCVYHGYCMGAGCHVDAKSSPAVSTIPRALETGRLDLVTRAHVTTIESDADGRVRGVNYILDGEELFQPAEVVLLASYTYENVRLLLLSTSAAYPQGLSNNGGQVGRHYFSHAQFGGVSALFPFDLENWYGTPGQGVAIDNWADDNFDHAELDFIGGGSLYVYTERRPMAAVNGAGGWAAPGTPNWGSAWKASIIQNCDRTNSAYIQRTTLPYQTNHLDLDPAVRDPLGYPVIRVTGAFRANERNMSPFLGERMREWYTAAGAIQLRGDAGLGNAMGVSTHAYGGTRMGDDPATSVLDRWGFSHEARNLGVLGGSVMGTSGARNPTLTAQALAWRTAEHLSRNWDEVAGA
jgi:gluconate 2-dehydrogenase alpha chain